MKYKMRIASFIWIVMVLFATLFDEVIDFPIPLSSMALAFVGIIFYLATRSEVKKGNVDISDLNDTEKAFYDRYVKIGEDDLDQRERDLYVQPRFNRKVLMVLVVVPLVFLFIELITNFI